MRGYPIEQSDRGRQFSGNDLAFAAFVKASDDQVGKILKEVGLVK